MSRGIRVFTVPGDAISKEAILTTGEDAIQLLDMVVVRPSSISEVTKIYRFLGPGNFTDITPEDQTITFTDNIIVPNVTPNRKAHQDDYRSLIKMLFKNSANKFGDIHKNTHDFTDASLKFNTLYTLYTHPELSFIGNDSNTIKVNLGTSDIFKLSKTAIDMYSKLYVNNDIWASGAISSNGDMSSLGNLSIVGSSNLAGDVIAGANIGVVGDLQVNGNSNVAGTSNSNLVSANIMNILSSSNYNIVNGLNADKIDGYDAQSIIDMIPSIVGDFNPYQGYAKLFGSLLIQWGRASSANYIQFATEFKDDPFYIGCIRAKNTSGNIFFVLMESDTLRFKAQGLRPDSSGTHAATADLVYIAIGEAK